MFFNIAGTLDQVSTIFPSFPVMIDDFSSIFDRFGPILDPFLACVTHLSGFGGPYRGVGCRKWMQRALKHLKIIFSIPRRVFRDPDPSVTESVTKALHTAGRVTVLQQCSSGFFGNAYFQSQSCFFGIAAML